jgi:methyl-accepting chemotaxis protein
MMAKLSGSGFKMNMGIRGRLILGFSAVGLILAIAVGTTLIQVSSLSSVTTRIVDLRMPTAAASSSIMNDINASLAALRGWMLTGNPVFKKQRAAVWTQMENTAGEMDRLSATWTNPANKEKWADFKVVLAEFKAAQLKVENIAKSPDEQPASKMLVTDAAPRAAKVVSLITQMIDNEAKQATTDERKNLFLQMANFRGSFGLGLANIRAFLLTGDKKFATLFENLWKKNEKAFGNIQSIAHLLSAEQRTAFTDLTKQRAEFAPLPPKMFTIRGSKKWNMALYLLVTEAAPRAGKLMTALAGPVKEDGSRSGGMVDNQKSLMTGDGNQVAADADALIMLQWLLFVVGIGVAAVIVFFTSRAIVNPVKAIIDVMEDLTQGNLEVEISGLEKSDETGDMARAVQVFKESAIDKVRLEEEERKAEVERQNQVEIQRKEEDERNKQAKARQETVDQLTAGFDKAIEEVLQVVAAQSTEMESSAQSMSDIAKRTVDESITVSSAAEEATTSVQTVASAAEELSSSIDEISRQVAHSSEMSKKAVSTAEATNQTIGELVEGGQRIGEVVVLINDIADQTNLLALNATIEAARAGEAGKGFAVVASEVKNLANQTAQATEGISSQISAMQGITNQAVDAIGEISSAIAEMNEISTSIASAVEEQGAATGEISRSVQEAASGTQEVASSIIKVKGGSEETGEASGNVLEASRELAERFQALRTEVEEFLSAIKSA